MKLTENEIQKFNTLVANAREKATLAVEESGIRDGFPCGFAWVRISGRGKFALYAKEYLKAYKNYEASGLTIWYSHCYDCKGTQSVDRHNVAVGVFAECLKEAGIKAFTGFRLD
jgi:hypothetical protein